MTVPLDTLDSRVPTVCRMLRTKTAFGTHFVEGEAEAWQNRRVHDGRLLVSLHDGPDRPG
jgi:hypothetical protein